MPKKNLNDVKSDGFRDASLYYGDCLDLMKEWVAGGRRETVDLVYLDPPFNSKAYYNILYGNGNGNGNGAPAQVMAFDDTWIWNESALERLDNLRRPPYPHEVVRAVDGLHAILGECEMLSYLTYMAERLYYCRLMLKPSGSIYLHCDPAAGHYLKILMDAVFGRGNFRNEIIWRIGWVSGYKTKKQGFIRNHDTLLYYVKGPEFTFCKKYIPYSDGYVRRDGKPPEGEGIPMEDTWNCSAADVLDSIMIKSFSKEKTGYPTQKPLALLRRIIEASSNKGGLILDPFCGCGTTVVAAHGLKRRWCGIDISAFPVELIRSRLHDIRGQIYVDGIPRDIKGARMLAQKPFEFEKWAIMQIPGMLPNAKQTGDGGVDGRGFLENDIKGAVKPPKSKTPLVIAQVTKSSGVNLNKIRALRASMEEQKALFGVYMTLDSLTQTDSVRRIMTDAGTVKHGTSKYPRLQLYSIADFFNGKNPNLPPLATPRLLARGASRTSIRQEDLDYEGK